jgi:acetyl-CoA carboxylase biotin carboxyl carrier protein
VSADLPLSPEDVAEIVAILEGSAYEKLEVRTTRFTLRVARAEGEAGGWTQEWLWSAPAAAAVVVESAVRVEVAEDLVAVRPPLPGTFYRAPQPGAPPFVEIGDTVGPDTVVAIIETMKLMNPVHAGASGTIEAILVDNGAPVEADAVLMTIRPGAISSQTSSDDSEIATDR